MLSISVRPERYSYHMIEKSGEFVVNLTTEALVRATDYCGVRSGRDVDKFKEMHLTPQPSREVSAPGIAESPVNIECRVREIKPFGSHNMIIADVVAVTIDDEYMDEKGKFHLNSTGLVTYSHGEYFLLGKKLGELVVLAPPMLKMLPTMFAWPQLVTALTGGIIALAILPVLRKALHK